MPEDVDLLIVNGHLFTMQGSGVGYLRDGAIAVRGSRIVAIGPSPELSERYAARECIDAARCAVLPGLIDVHMHTSFAVIRGVAQDVSNWMQQALAPFSKHMTDEAARAGTRLNILEAVQAGTTTMSDFIRPYAGWAESFVEAGVRAVLTPQINAFRPGSMAGWKVGALYPFDDVVARESIDAAVRFIDRWHGVEGGRITTMLGPQGPDMLSLTQLREVKRIARERGLMIHMHVAQGDREIDQMVKRYGQRTPAFLQENDYLDEGLLAVHLTEADDEETDLIADSGARMALCSGSIGIIDGIVPPAHRFQSSGGVVGLGSDQASGNNCNNLFNEMKLTALFNKIRFGDPTIMPAWQVLRMATIDGARALGIADRVGSLQVGKQADVILVDLNTPNLLPVLEEPVRTIVPNLVYAGTGKEVCTVIVAGRVIMRERKVMTLEAQSIQDEAQRQAERVAHSVAEDPAHLALSLVHATRKGTL